MTGPSSRCAGCESTLAPGQLYCLACGTRVDHGTPDARDVLLAHSPAPVDPPPPGPAAARAPGAARLAILPGREVSLTAAIGVFALVLGLAAWAGAATTRPGPAPAPVTLAAASTTTGEVTPATPITPSADDAGALSEAPPADAAEPSSGDLGDLPQGFPVVAGSIGPSHGFAHVRTIGAPVRVMAGGCPECRPQRMCARNAGAW